MDYFKDKTAIITGAASGIGRALSEHLGRRGAIIVAADINLEGAERTAAAITQAGGRTTPARLDVSRAEEVRRLVDKTAAEYGRLNFMFNNAGIAVGAEVRDMTIDHWRRIVDVNLMGVIYGTDAAYRVMIEQGFGHIVNTASLAGLVGTPPLTSYATTKHAVVGLSTSLRAEAAGFGVNVSVVCPGFIQTGIFDAATMVKARKEDFLSQLPVKLMDVQTAAKKIIRGVERNRAIIVFPFYARLLWRLNRLHPSLLAPLAAKAVKDFRKARVDTAGRPAGR